MIYSSKQLHTHTHTHTLTHTDTHWHEMASRDDAALIDFIDVVKFYGCAMLKLNPHPLLLCIGYITTARKNSSVTSKKLRNHRRLLLFKH